MTDSALLEAMKRESLFLRSEIHSIKMVMSLTLRAVMSNAALRKEYEEMLGELRTAPQSAPTGASEQETIHLMAVASARAWLEKISAHMDDPLRPRAVLGAVPPTPQDA